MEVVMVQTGTVRVMQVLLGFGLLVGALLFARMLQASALTPTGGVRPDLAANIYKRRIEMTQTLLRTNQLDMAIRH
jgi:hypothetical protein